MEKKLPPGKRLLPPGAEVKLNRKDYKKPITKELRRKKKFEKRMQETVRRIEALGSVVEDGSGTELSAGSANLPVRLVEIFTSMKTGVVQIYRSGW